MKKKNPQQPASFYTIKKGDVITFQHDGKNVTLKIAGVLVPHQKRPVHARPAVSATDKQ
jgi:hypothetical protein